MRRTKKFSRDVRKPSMTRIVSFMLSVFMVFQTIPIKFDVVHAAEGDGSAKFLEGIDIGGIKGIKRLAGHDVDKYNEIMKYYDSKYNSEAEALQIGTKEELLAFAKVVNEGFSFEGKFVKMTADINLKGGALNYEREPNKDDSSKYTLKISSVKNDGSVDNVWTPIGTKDKPFRGTFDGGNHEISNMVVIEKDGAENYAGLFGYTDGNVAFENIGISEGSHVIASSSGSSSSNAGGLIGSVGESATIKNCNTTCTVSSSSYALSSSSNAGGLIGNVGGSATIKNCNTTGEVSSSSSKYYNSFSSSNAGGLIGNVEGDVENMTRCYTTGDVSSTTNAGGLIGRAAQSKSLSYSYWNEKKSLWNR